MAYAQIHTQALRHRKVLSLSAHAFRVWVAGQCYCQEHLSDGVIPKVALVALGVPVKAAWVGELLTQQLWHDHAEHYEVHDWADWNETRERVAARRKAKQERHKRWQQRRAEDASRDASLGASRDASRDGAATATATAGTTPYSPPPDCEALWEAWREVANTHGAKFPVTPPAKDIERLLELGRTYTADDIRRAAQAFWSKDAKARSLAYFAPQVGELLAPTVLSPEDEWRKGFFHFWTCRECGEVHSTDEREVYQRKPCQKEHGTMSYAEFKARQAAKGAA